MTQNFQNLGRDLDIHVHKSHRLPNKLNIKRYFPRLIIIKLSKMKDKERVLKITREKKLIIYKGTCTRQYQ